MSEDNIQKMRETIDRLTKGKSEAEQSVSDLTVQLRVRDAREAFREEGYNPKHGDLYAAVNPEGDITAEVVVTFAEDQGLVVLEANQDDDANSGDSKSDEDEGKSKLAGMSGGGSRAGEGGAGGAGSESLTRTEWKELHRTDPSAAQAAIASGRVEISKDNVYVKNSGSTPGTNPYAAAQADTKE